MSWLSDVVVFTVTEFEATVTLPGAAKYEDRQSSPVPYTAFPPPPDAFWNVGALPAPLLVRIWPEVPLPICVSTPLVLYTMPVVRPLKVIVPDDVRPVRLVSVPAIVLLPAIERPPALLLI